MPKNKRPNRKPGAKAKRAAAAGKAQTEAPAFTKLDLDDGRTAQFVY